MIKTRLYSEKQDYPTLSKWWQDQECPVPHPTQLDTLGVMVSVDDEDVAYICAYLAVGVGVAHLDHLITNPAFKSPGRKLAAIRAMLESMFRVLKDNDYQLIKAFTWSKTLSRVCQQKLGWQRVGGGYENLSVMIT